MAVYDLEEQEQIDELKSWWKQYQKLVFLVIIAAAITIGGIQAWRYYQTRQALEAGELYSQLQGAAVNADQKKVQDIAALLVDKYPRTGYTVFAALAGAKAALGSGDATEAKSRLQWVIDSGRDDAARDIARLRLAAVLLNDKKYDEAIVLLEVKHGETLDALYADLKGDVLTAQGNGSEARKAYQLALDKSEAKSNYRALIQIKLDSLGETK